MPLGVYHPETCRRAAAMKVKIRREAKLQWERQWGTNSTTAGATRRLIRTPGKGSLGIYKGICKAWSSAMVQLRTGRIGLSRFLAKIGVSESSRCGRDEGIQIPRHIL
jgi:hypothetical protein